MRLASIPTTNDDLVQLVKQDEDYLDLGPRSASVLEAMRKVDRKSFIPDIQWPMSLADHNLVVSTREVSNCLKRILNVITPTEDADKYRDLYKFLENTAGYLNAYGAGYYVPNTYLEIDEEGHSPMCLTRFQVAQTIGQGYKKIDEQVWSDFGKLHKSLPTLIEVFRKNLEEHLSTSDKTFQVPSKELAYQNQPVLVHSEDGLAHSCPQPSMVGAFLDLMELREGMSVLAISSRSSYLEACVSEMVGQNGYVAVVERQQALASLDEQNLRGYFGTQYGDRIEVFQKDVLLGLKEKSPFDVIYLTESVQLDKIDNVIGKAVQKYQNLLSQQLREGTGKLLIPIVCQTPPQDSQENSVKIYTHPALMVMKLDRGKVVGNTHLIHNVVFNPLTSDSYSQIASKKR